MILLLILQTILPSIILTILPLILPSILDEILVSPWNLDTQMNDLLSMVLFMVCMQRQCLALWKSFDAT